MQDPRDHLPEHGIETIVDRPAVGENLQDQLQARTGLQYIATHSGPMMMALLHHAGPRIG